MASASPQALEAALAAAAAPPAALLAALAAAGIGHQVHYAPPVHRMEAYAFLGETCGSLAVSERAAAEVLSLPLYPGLSVSEVDAVCAVLNSVN